MSRLAVAALAAAVLTLAGPASAQAEIAPFVTPSKQIYCAYISDGGGQIRCDPLFLNDRGFLLKTSGKARKIKITDTIADPEAPVLAYSKTFRRGPFRCTSRRAGLTCEHRSNGHGFFLSRERQRVY
ncbi:hypothetical protein LRS13_01920 [Svornostia abyssi]|uniref:Uncharacterized protein n=1 Tax=Svornostia abyssi TaxID=2898438 RepID=A0ABY5PI12_9ACTN|nr:hypothetical protein LRS13_01920 [Parviterribacteraceae bacterium J379]